MTTKTDEKVEELKGIFEATEISDIKRMNYRLSDAIREGASVTEQTNGWGDGEKACALHAAVIAAQARGHMS